MAINYVRAFSFFPWVDNQDVVAAEGPRGLNQPFRDIEAEFDKIAVAFGQVNTALQKGISLQSVTTLSKQLTANQITDPDDVDLYNNADFPGGLKKVYQVSIEPAPGAHGQVSYNLIYTPTGDKTKVTIWFKEEKNAPTRVTARIFSIS